MQDKTQHCSDLHFMVVSPSIIRRCRLEIEPQWRAYVRKMLTPLVRWYFGFDSIGEGFQFGWGIDIQEGVRVGRFVYVGKGFESGGPVNIGDLCMISTHVRIVGNDHRFDVLTTPTRLAFQYQKLETILEADVWVGKGATIFAGLTIGRGAVIAAGSVVTRNVEPYTIVAGVPARVIRSRFDSEQIKRHDDALFGQSRPAMNADAIY